jgi:hypothetical protein
MNRQQTRRDGSEKVVVECTNGADNIHGTREDTLHNKQSTSKLPTHYLFRITDGPQTGANAIVVPGAKSTLGRALDSDIVLLDPRVQDQALTFKPDSNGGMTIEVSDGILSCNGEPVANDELHCLIPDARYSIGSTVFTLSVVNTKSEPLASSAKSGSLSPGKQLSQGTGDSLPDYETSECTSTGQAKSNGNSDGSGSLAAHSDAAEPQNVWLPRVLFGFAAVLCITIGVSYFLHNADSARDTVSGVNEAESPDQLQQSSVVSNLEQTLIEAGFDTVSLIDDGSTVTPRITGYVTSRSQLNELRQVLRGTVPRSAIDVHVQSDIVEGVRNVYRTNGVEAAVELVGLGEVAVITAESEPHDPAFMKAAAMEDVAGLIAIDARNEPPPIEPATPAVIEPPAVSPARIREEPGKRVVAVIQGNPSYVVTEDDSRYFVGSSLPTGHTIEAIEDKVVMLDWQGQKTLLEF